MLAPDHLLRQAATLLDAREVAAALDTIRAARKAAATWSTCVAAEWECLMLLGRYAEAWQLSDEIADSDTETQRFWDRKPLTGKKVMLRCLHGYGDALQFIRYAPRLAAEAQSLCVEAHPEMVELLRACDGVSEVITWGDGAPLIQPAWNSQVEVMELPWLFHDDPATRTVTYPYLDPAKLARLPETKALCTKLRSSSSDRFKVGIAWRASNWNPARSLPLRALLRSLEHVPSCDWFSLQQDGEADLVACGAKDIQNIAADFADLAVRMAALDAIVTVDGVLAHLAGALGKPVLLLLPFAADWRWGLADTTPWYPKTRLFRQQTSGDWRVPLAEASHALTHLTAL